MAVTDAPRDEALPPPLAGDEPPTGGDSTASRLPSWMPAERLVSILVIAAAMIFTFWQLHPSKLLADTTPAGGDMGAHVWAPAYLRDNLLPSLRFTGWTPDWYAGFPAFHYYMVLPSLAIVVLDVLLPYGVAFKLVSISGLLALPVALYLFGRLARLPFPGPALLAAMAVPFLFDRSFSIYGGNVPSTLAGEFAFSISLAFCVVFLGVVLRGLETGRHRGLAALLLGLTVLCHLIPAIFALIGAGVAFGLRSGRRMRAWWLLCVGFVGSLLAAWWALPFWWQRAYMNDMGWEKLEEYWENIFPGDIGQAITRLAGGAANNGNRGALPGDLTWIIVFAVVGFGLSIVLRRRPGTYLGVLAIVTAIAFRVAPQSRFWNARLLPFLYLCLFMLAAIAILEIVNAVSVLIAKDTRRPSRATLLVAPAAACVIALAFMGMGLRSLPFGSTNAEDGSYEWLAFKTKDSSYIRSWADWNYSGYEEKPSAPEFFSVVSTMRELGDDPEHGCGRAMWEYEKELDRFGTPMALMLLPYYTDSCIGSMEGLYFEASTTTPYHFLNQSELSTNPSNAQRDLRYQGLNVDLGVQHLQLMGVKYYMAFSEQAVAQAEGNEHLTEVASVPGERGEWHIYEVEDAPLVESATSLPAVVSDVPEGGRGWQDMAENWYLDPSQWDTLLASGGPDEWQRITSGDEPQLRDVEPVEVTNIDEGTSTISFDVSDVGTPVLVKASYFPNWEVEGADGPWRVAPNFMVVVPTEEHVELRYGRSSIEWFSWLLTFIGIALTVVLWRRAPLTFPDDVEKPRRWRLRLERLDEPGDADDAPPGEIELEPEPRQ